MSAPLYFWNIGTQHDSCNSTQLITLAEVISFPITPLLLVPSNPDKHHLCSAGLQVTGCVNITWLIGCDKSCTLPSFFSCVFRPSVHQNALPASKSLGWLWIGLFVHPYRSKSSRPTLCPCALSPWERGLRLPAVCCLLWLEIKACVEVGMDGIEWEVMWLDVGW